MLVSKMAAAFKYDIVWSMIEAVAAGSSGEIFLQDPFHRSSSVCVPLGVL